MKHLTDALLNEYLDNALPAFVRRHREAHLKDCAHCRARLEELRLVFSALDNLAEVDLSHDLAPGVLARLPAKRSQRLWSPAFAAQVGAALGAMVWLGSEVGRTLRLPSIPAIVIRLPQLTWPSLELAFTLPALRLPSFHLPTLSDKFATLHFPFSSFSMALLVIAAVLLWMTGNLTLLRNGMEIKK